MNKLNKVILDVFSIIILVIGICINLVAVKWVDLTTIYNIIKYGIQTEPSSQIILIVTEICMLFAIIAIFVDSPKKKTTRTERDVLMQNDNGKLMISRNTIENLANSVIKDFSGVKESSTRIQLDSENNVIVIIDLVATKDVIIKELTLNLQNSIKDVIKKSSDLEVKEVNVRINNISQEENQK